jgi:hypothetical protein
MTDPYTSLARQLVAAAERQEVDRRGRRLRDWRPRRMPAVAIAAVLVLAGAAVAVAATGLLEGSPVKPGVNASPLSGNGLPLGRKGAGMLVRTADPSGGLSWGMRVLHTTRGQVCVQVGRVTGFQLGELGTDSAFGNDGRFHPLPPDVLPPGYGGSSGQIECAPSGGTLIAEYPNADRNAVRLLPEEFHDGPGGPPKLPPAADLRTLAYGLLGPHAVSVTFRTPSGLRTKPVSGREGGFLIVEPGGYVHSPSRSGQSVLGEASSRSVRVTSPSSHTRSIVSAATFRFGTTICSQGTGAPVHTRCPSASRGGRNARMGPSRNLHQKIRLTLLQQSATACRAAYLLYPCYGAQLAFQAPYAVSSASTDYEIHGFAHCDAGGRPETGWALERDVKAHEAIHTTSIGLFTLTPSCLAHEGFEVRYGQSFGATGPPKAPVIIGVVRLSEAITPRYG